MEEIVKKFISLLLVILAFTLSGCKKNKQPSEYTYAEESVKVGDLNGKLTLPDTVNQVPAVIIIPGSGPTDMDGTIYSLKTYQDLALKLATKGIASLRYNKRSYQFLEQMVKDYDATIEDEYVNDALIAYNFLKTNEKIDVNNIFLIGHSFGAQISPFIINQEPNLKGAILLAGTTEHLLDLLLEQYKAQNVTNYEGHVAAVALTKSLTEVKSGEEHYSYYGAFGAYWVYYNKINWQDELLDASTNHPLLIIQGELDLQVTIKHYDKYKELLKDNKQATFKKYSLLNHCFVNGEGDTIYTAYKIERPIPDEVINDISDWIKKVK